MSDSFPNGYSHLQQPQQQQQQQSQQSGGEFTHGGVMNLSLPQQQIILELRNQVQQGHMTQQQALDRLAMMQASAQSFQEQSVPQQFPPGFNSGAMPSVTPQQQFATSRMGQNLNPSGVDSHQQIPQPVSRPPGNLADVPLPQLRALSTQLLFVVAEGEKNLQSTSSPGEGNVQRQQLRAKIELNKQRLRALHEVISMKMRASGDPVQQTVNGPWLSNSTLISSHVSANGLPSNSVLAQMNGAPPPQITHPPSQPPIQSNKLPVLSEERFSSNFMQFARSKGIRLSERDLIIDDRRINLWFLHRTVFSRNGFDSVSARDEWPAIGAALGFPPVDGDPGRPPRCEPVIAQRLQQLYNDVLRHFDQVYISSIVARLRRMQASRQLPQPPQPQTQPHQPTEADYQALLANITSETSVLNAETMGILPRFSHTSGRELEAHHVPQHVIAFVEQNRVHLQRAAQDQNGFRTGITSPQNAPLDNGLWWSPPAPASRRDPPQCDDSEPAQSPEGPMSHYEGEFDEEVEIALSRLEI